MKRQPPPKEAAGIALFPFLAVLLCTMGALLVLLVAIARHSRDQAVRSARTETQVDEDFEVERDKLRWRIEQLRGSREKTLAQLTDERRELSHQEEHARRVRDEIDQIEKAAEDLARSGQSDDDTNHKLRDRLTRYDKDIVDLKSDVELEREKTKGRKDSYAIIPYDGANQTRRRPIYIECRAENTIILQPEGIVLDEIDFLGQAGPSNPLAASLRAAREFMMRNIDPTKDADAEPYPLLLVRPDGIPAYYMARQAMVGWGSDFGYELIEQDWKLQFQATNLALAQAMSRAVDESRKRQELIAQAAPRLMSAEDRLAYRTAAANRAGGSGGSGTTQARPTGYGGKTGRGGSSHMRGLAGSRYANSDEQQAAANAAALAPYQNLDLAGNVRSGGSDAPGIGPGGLGNGGIPNGVGGPNAGGSVGLGAPGSGGIPGAGGQAGLGPGGPGAGLPGQMGDPLASSAGAWGAYGTGGPGTGTGPAGTAAAGSQFGAATGAYGSATGTTLGNGASAGANATAGQGGSGPGGDSSGTSGAPGSASAGGAGSGSQQGPTLGAAGGASGGAPGSASVASGGQGLGGGAAGASSGGGSSAGSPSGGSASPSGGAAGMAGASGAPSSGGGVSLTMPNGSTQTGSGAAQQASGGNTPTTASEKPRSAFETAGKTYAQPKPVVNDGAGGGQSSGASSSSTSQNGPSAGSKLSSQQREEVSRRTKSKGRNWALPEEKRASISCTRLIQLECRNDRLVMLSERGDYPRRQEIMLGNDTGQAIEPLVASVWERINSWGIAGDGMHWKPVLVVNVQPDGQSRYEDLIALLNGSGLEVRSKNEASRAAASPQPTNKR
ncbi:MAG TPA: hypothetical protein VHV77_12145 [Pirellulales bacterium]|nr:hypothetical protein [Pirellulales bacterium]